MQCAENQMYGNMQKHTYWAVKLMYYSNGLGAGSRMFGGYFVSFGGLTPMPFYPRS